MISPLEIVLVAILIGSVVIDTSDENIEEEEEEY